MMGSEDPEKEADKVLERADFNQNGTLEFSEFVSATMDKRKLLSDNKLKAAFHLFDISGDGKISLSEISNMLNLKESKNSEL